MGVIQIGFLVAGLICFILSFFLSEKLSSSDVNEFEKMSKIQMNTIVEKQLREADSGIKVMIDEGMGDAMEEFDAKADRLLNSKIMSISDYSDSVLSSIEKSHKEITFMYNMLLEKQETLTDLTKDIQNLMSNLREIKANVESSVANGEFTVLTDQLERLEMAHDYGQIIEETPAEPIESVIPMESSVEYDENDTIKNQNDKIVKMYNEGFSEMEIAKRLGRGLGEVKLVLGLFNKG